jgi:7-cyano-7-deazaguanine synthase
VGNDAQRNLRDCLKMKKKAVVIHSGGMDSSICLALALEAFRQENVLSLSFSYHQRHAPELVQAAKICQSWGVDHTILQIDCLHQITENALTNHTLPIKHLKGEAPNTSLRRHSRAFAGSKLRLHGRD